MNRILVISGIVVSLVTLLIHIPVHGTPAPPNEPNSHLPATLDRLLEDPCLRRARVGVRVESLGNDRILYDRNGDRSLMPASNVKIFTAAAALQILGPGYRFPTTFHVNHPPVRGVVDGPLYLKGWGAPDLVGETWWLMVRELRRRGLRTVKGDLILDDTYFDSAHRPPGWPRPVVDRAYNAPVSALSCNYNVVSVRVVPEGMVGERPLIQLIPFQAHLQINNQARIRNAPTRVSVFRSGGPGSRQIVVKGSIRPGSDPFETIRSIEDPTLYAGYAFREVAEAEGIRIAGSIRKGATPDEAVEFFRYHSKPASEILRDMNKYSNNFIAEMILKTLAAETGQVPGTTEQGRYIVRTILEERGVDLRGVEIRDGSGLSDANRATPAALVSTLAIFGRDFGIFPELLASLPIAGIDGTLKDRNGDSNRNGRVRAKTGRLRGVDSLSGYAGTGGRNARIFSLLVNGSSCSHEKVTAVLDRIADRIATSSDPAESAGGGKIDLKDPASPPGS